MIFRCIPILFTLFTMAVISAETTELSHLPQLNEQTKHSMQRNKNVTIDPTGQLSLDTSNSYRSVTFIRVGSDGKKQKLCTSSEIEARKFLAGEDIQLHDEGK